MEVVQLDTEGFAAMQVFDEAVVCLFRFAGFLLREVDEVGSVRDDVLGGVVLVLDAVRFEAVTVLVLQRWVLPFPLRFKKKGECIAASESQRMG